MLKKRLRLKEKLSHRLMKTILPQRRKPNSEKKQELLKK